MKQCTVHYSTLLHCTILIMVSLTKLTRHLGPLLALCTVHNALCTVHLAAMHHNTFSVVHFNSENCTHANFTAAQRNTFEIMNCIVLHYITCNAIEDSNAIIHRDTFQCRGVARCIWRTRFFAMPWRWGLWRDPWWKNSGKEEAIRGYVQQRTE